MNRMKMSENVNRMMDREQLKKMSSKDYAVLGLRGLADMIESEQMDPLGALAGIATLFGDLVVNVGIAHKDSFSEVEKIFALTLRYGTAMAKNELKGEDGREEASAA